MSDPASIFDQQVPPEKNTTALPSAGAEKQVVPEPAVPEETGTAETIAVPDESTGDAGVSSAEPQPPPTVSELPQADVAVVFVHGMGTSKPGDTLERFLNPSLVWIKRATTHDHHLYINNDIDTNMVEGVNILERNRAIQPVKLAPDKDDTQPLQNGIDIDAIRVATLQSANTSPAIFVPPFLDVDLHQFVNDPATSTDVPTVDTPNPGAATPQNVGKMPPAHQTTVDSGNPPTIRTGKLVAVETWWDREFEPPAFKEVAYWALGVAPCLILRHLALLWETNGGIDSDSISPGSHGRPAPHSQWRTIWRFLLAFWRSLIFGSAAVLLQWAICLLLVFGAVPFLRNYVRTIILKMTSSFGDVLVYVHDGIRSAAIRSTVTRSFEWLYKTYQVKKMIVIGYSLGSVIAYDVLSTRDVTTTKDNPNTVDEGKITFVTLGSPLKKTNVLLELARDEQRIALGIPFAFASLTAASIAFWTFMTNEAIPPPEDSGWWLSASIVVATLALGIGSHSCPLGSWFGRALSLAQVVGTLAALASIGIAGSSLDGSVWWIVALGLLAVLLLLSINKIAQSRTFAGHNINRMSPFLYPGWVLMIVIGIACWNDILHIALATVLMSLVFSVMTGSNPLEEFAAKEKPYQGRQFARRQPWFGFATPVKQWIDFWARKDLVAEFGLGEVRYTRTANGLRQDNIHPRSRRVTNLNDYAQDHSVYQANIEQFIAPLTRLFLEELGFRHAVTTTSASTETTTTTPSLTTPALALPNVDYDRDITHAMRTRGARVSWFNRASLLLLLTSLLFSPSIYRSIGEAIVFNSNFEARKSTWVASTEGQSIGASIEIGDAFNESDRSNLPPEWFMHIHNANPVTCSKCARQLLVVPEGVTEAVVSNTFVRKLVVFGLGYGVVFAAYTIVRNTFLLAPWKIWESALLDTIVQPRPGISRNLLLRAGVFWLCAIAVLLLAVGIHVGWYGTEWLWDHGFTPAQTTLRFIDWIFPPGWEIQSFIDTVLPSGLEFQI